MNRGTFEKVLSRQSKNIDRLKEKEGNLLKKHMELENNIHKYTTSNAKNSRSRTVKENLLRSEIETYIFIFNELKILFKQKFNSDFILDN